MCHLKLWCGKMKKLSSRKKGQYEKLRTSQTLTVVSSFNLKVSYFFRTTVSGAYIMINDHQHACTLTVFFFSLIGARSLSIIRCLRIPSKSCVCVTCTIREIGNRCVCACVCRAHDWKERDGETDLPPTVIRVSNVIERDMASRCSNR